MNADSCFLLQSPPAPKSLVVYVYEGNDFNNNLAALRSTPASGSKRRDVQKLIATENRSASDVPCYVQVNKLAVNLIATAITSLFRAQEVTPGRLGQPVEQGSTTKYLPMWLQGPALELDEAAIGEAIEVLSQSLDHLLARFEGTPVLVDNLPSVLTPYRLLAKTVSTQTYHGGQEIHATQAVRQRSDALCKRLRDVVLAKGASFLDARPALDRAAAKQMIHGRRDWKHLNRAGQTALGTSVAEALKHPEHENECALALP